MLKMSLRKAFSPCWTASLSTVYCQQTPNIEDVHKEGLDFIDSRVVVVFVLYFTSAELSNQFGNAENSISRHSLKWMLAFVYMIGPFK